MGLTVQDDFFSTNKLYASALIAEDAATSAERNTAIATLVMVHDN